MDPLKFLSFALFLLFCTYSMTRANPTIDNHLTKEEKRYIFDQINQGQRYWPGPASSHPMAVRIYDGTREVIKDVDKEITIFIFDFQSATRGMCRGKLKFLNNKVGKDRGRESYKVLRCDY
uniref:Peptidyl-prolyl cis-trans isomerase B n=1 Tax=Lygus hesperus TaxID=30085 RepID=A0A0A9X9Q3_LYGHE